MAAGDSDNDVEADLDAAILIVRECARREPDACTADRLAAAADRWAADLRAARLARGPQAGADPFAAL